jgi:eukaryotic-like serine/threonine-protein kinase
VTPESFQAIRNIFDEVIDLPSAQRAPRVRELTSALASALTSSDEVVDGVLSLLAAHEAALGATVSKPVHAMLASASGVKIATGDVLGAWRIEREIGHGGMGTVYLVERSDGHFKQTAALKFLRGLPSAERLQYFFRERQMLATLTHPNVARLLDGGATDRGQPYLVMEYVDGAPIDVYTRTQRLNTTQILTLFATACEAVAFAHRQLIVHCDLKPSNLLINKDGRPVLLDFGIARLVDRVGLDDAAGELAPTSAGYTPRYASPEQREHGTVSTASDIYSLGVMLGELLEMGKSQDAELAAILAKATAALPGARYATVESLIDEIARYRRREPLRAMPTTRAYTTRKFIERRWPWVLASTAFALTVIGFTVKVVAESQKVAVESQRAKVAEQAAIVQRDRALRAEREALAERDATQAARADALHERDGAARERDRAVAAELGAISEKNKAIQAEISTRQTADFLVSVFDSSNPNAQTGDPPASKLIEAAEQRIATGLVGQDGTKAELFSTLGRVQSNMGNTKQANANYVQALALERKQNRPLVLAQLLTRVASLRGANFGVAQAEPYAREALSLREKYAAPNSEAAAESLSILGNIFTTQGKREESLQLLTRALRIRQQRDANSEGVAATLHFLALHSVRFQDYEKSFAEFKRSMEIRATLVGEGHPDYLVTLEEYANALNLAHRYAEAEAAMRRALAQRRKLHGNDNEKIAFGLNVLGNIVNRQGREREAIVIIQEALAIVEKKFGTQSMPYASVLNNLAISQQNVGDLTGAERAYTEAMQIFASIWPETDLTLARVRFNVARIRIQMRQFDGVETLLQKSYATRQKALGDKHGDVIETSLLMGDWHLAAGNLTKAIETIEQISPLMPVKDAFTTINFERLRARVAVKQGNRDEILNSLERVEQMTNKAFGETSTRNWLGKVERAEWLATTNQPSDKLASRVLAAEILTKVVDKLDPGAPVIAKLKQLAE